MKRARELVALAYPGGGMVVTSLIERYADDDPIVVAHPWAFDDADEPPIERATARPGERRVVRPAK